MAVSAARRLIGKFAVIGGLWVCADLGYYQVLPAFGIPTDYNLGAIPMTLYYLFWAGAAVIVFWPDYAEWPRHSRWSTFSNRLSSLSLWLVAFFGAVAFATYVLPNLPPFETQNGAVPPGPAASLAVASPEYFLPKSVEILFQQLLVVALVLAMASESWSLRRISIACAVLFGAVHLLLVFGGAPFSLALRFAVLATVAGSAFPYLLLRVRNGWAYSYVLHWGFYASILYLARGLGFVPEVF